MTLEKAGSSALSGRPSQKEPSWALSKVGIIKLT